MERQEVQDLRFDIDTQRDLGQFQSVRTQRKDTTLSNLKTCQPYRAARRDAAQATKNVIW